MTQETKFRFSKTTLASITCPPDVPKLRLRDTAVPGLTLIITLNGSRTYYLRKKVNGRAVEVRIGAEAELTVDQARKRAAEVNLQIVGGRDPAAEKRASREGGTLGEMWDAYRATVIKGERTMIEDDGLWRRYLEPWKSKSLADINEEAVQRLYAKIAGGNMHRESTDRFGHKRPIKGGTIAANRTMQLFRAMFNACAKSFGMPGFNPVRGVRKVTETACERYLTADEFPAFWRAIEGQGELIRDALKLALFTGQRRATLLAMRWADVNLTFNTWTIPAQVMKSGKMHTVPLVPAAVEILERRKAAADKYAEWVLDSPQSATGFIRNPEKALQAITTTAGIAPVSLHDLRRTCATWMNATGASEATIAAVLAHKYRNVTGIYAKATADTMRQALEAAVAAMLKAATPKTRKQLKPATPAA